MTTKKPTQKKTTPKPAAKKTATRKKAAPKQNPAKDKPSSVDFTHQHEATHVAAAETVKINIVTTPKKKSLWRRIFGFGF